MESGMSEVSVSTNQTDKKVRVYRLGKQSVKQIEVFTDKLRKWKMGVKSGEDSMKVERYKEDLKNWMMSSRKFYTYQSQLLKDDVVLEVIEKEDEELSTDDISELSVL